MYPPKLKPALLATLITLSFNVHAESSSSSLEQRLDQLQQEMTALKQQLAAERSAREKQVDDAVKTAVASTAPAHENATTISGYGEAVYNNYRDGSVKDQADLRRFVLFFGHRFNDRLRLYSELEVEHALVESGQGELAMEQAYLEYGLTPSVNLRAGLMLMPLGFLNENHEPPTFYGVERTEVESRIIPSTWRELGMGVQGRLLDNVLEYNVGIVTSLDASKYSGASSGVRSMRSKGFKAAANDLALYAGLNYRQPGWSIGAGLFSGNTAQNGVGSTSSSFLAGKDARMTLWDIHGKYSIGDLELLGLYARGTLGDTLAINNAAGIASGSGNAAPQSFYGWYGQAAYHVWKQGEMRLSPFVRYERYNTQASVDAGFTANPLNDETVMTAGANFNLSREVVLKADYQNHKTDTKKDRFDLGVGYMF
ncbi:MAG: hypothetical protein ACYCY1_13735 [Sulfuriferula sp.]